MRVSNDSPASQVIVEQPPPPAEVAPPQDPAPAPQAFSQDGVDVSAPTTPSGARSSALPPTEKSAPDTSNNFDKLIDRNRRLNDRVGDPVRELGALYGELKNCKDPEKRSEIEEKIKEAHQDLLDALKDVQQFARLLASVSAGQEIAKGGAKTPPLAGALNAMNDLLAKLEGDLATTTDPIEKSRIKDELEDVSEKMQALGAQLEAPSAAVLSAIQQSYERATQSVQTMTGAVSVLETRVAELEAAHAPAEQIAEAKNELNDAKTSLGEAVDRQDAAAGRLGAEIDTQIKNNNALIAAAKARNDPGAVATLVAANAKLAALKPS